MPEDKSNSSLTKLLSNRLWRLSNLYWIEDERGNKVKFRPNLVQRLYLKDMWYLNVVLKSRQHGMSTLINIMQLDECLFNSNHTAGIVDKTDKDGMKKLSKMKFAYDHLDDPDDPTTSALGSKLKESVLLLRANDHEMEFSNESKVWCGTSLRGGTVQNLHISELGPIAYNYPKRAEEIRTGALNTVHAGSKITIESTHEGGRSGLNYEMVALSRSNGDGDDLSQLDWRFHFYAWWQDPKNSVPLGPRGLIMDKETEDYFKFLVADHGIELSDEQKNWYVKKYQTQREAMWREHPSIPEEALDAVVRGSIYGSQINELRRQGRIRDFHHDPGGQLFTAWDLGQSDYTTIWLIQMLGPEWSLLRYYASLGQGEVHYAQVVDEWEARYDMKISCHFLPHDADNRVGPGVTWRTALENAGLRNIKTVPRTPDVWIGINHLRNLLPRAYIHLEGCGTEWQLDGGVIIPSGLSCLQAYHTEPESSRGRIMEMPVHDENSHGADGLRTFAEAHKRGMIDSTSTLVKQGRRKLETKMGVRGVQRAKRTLKTMR
jgi:hypothetical protein